VTNRLCQSKKQTSSVIFGSIDMMITESLSIQEENNMDEYKEYETKAEVAFYKHGELFPERVFPIESGLRIEYVVSVRAALLNRNLPLTIYCEIKEKNDGRITGELGFAVPASTPKSFSTMLFRATPSKDGKSEIFYYGTVDFNEGSYDMKIAQFLADLQKNLTGSYQIHLANINGMNF